MVDLDLKDLFKWERELKCPGIKITNKKFKGVKSPFYILLPSFAFRDKMANLLFLPYFGHILIRS